MHAWSAISLFGLFLWVYGCKGIVEAIGYIMSLDQLACIIFWLLILFILISDTKYEQGMIQRKHLSFPYDWTELPKQWKPEEHVLQLNVKNISLLLSALLNNTERIFMAVNGTIPTCPLEYD